MSGTTTEQPVSTGREAPTSAVSWLAGGAAGLGLLLFTLQRSLTLSSGYGILDVLGWSDRDSVATALRLWCRGFLQWRIGAAYLMLHTGLFLPVFAVLLLVVVARLEHAMGPGESRLIEFLKRPLGPVSRLMALTLATVGLLLLVELLEDFGGARRLELWTGLFFGCIASALVLGASLWMWSQGWTSHRIRRPDTLALAAALVAILSVVLQAALAGAMCKAATSASGALPLARVHSLTPLFTALALAPPLIAALIWWFGGELSVKQDSERRARAAMRSGAAGVLGRSRYVLLALALYGVLTLGLDQCRDVLLGLAEPPQSFLWISWTGLWRLIVLGLTAVASGLFVYACWLWTRLVCMVERPGILMPGADTTGSWSADAQAWIGDFARSWARFLSLVPMAMFSALTAYAIGDAFTAASTQPRVQIDRLWAVGLLFVFGLGSLGIAAAFLWWRRRLGLPRVASYYNSEPDVHALLAGAGDALRERGGPQYRFAESIFRWLAWLLLPRVFPLAALAVMVLLRWFMALAPDTAAQAPSTLAIATLALCWWLSVFGGLSLAEQRQARPWILLLVALIGAWSLFGLTNNHVLPLLGAGQAPSGAALDHALARLRLDGAIVVTALALLSGGLWWVFTQDLSKAGLFRRKWERLLATAAAIVLALATLHWVDHRAGVLEGRQYPSAPQANAPTTSRPTFLEAVTAFVSALPELPDPSDPSDKRVFLIASEGGGIRSAYWTAQVLALLHSKVPYFDQRTFVLSGVSGGAVGEAVYHACVRDSATRDVATCVQRRFDGLDPLSPLLASLLFEDVFGRVLPLPMGTGWLGCDNPGCGHVNRALNFEREWIRRFPAMAEPLASSAPPYLLFNSTWAETGSRAISASVPLDSGAFPSAEYVQGRLAADINLITGAHLAARFPFINPLGGVQPASGSGIAGHLVDGGYFDNSGASSLSDAWRALEPELVQAKKSDWTPQIILIRNGQSKPECKQTDHQGPGPTCIERIRANLPVPADLDKAADKKRMDLYADLLGPLVALVNVSGIGAHGRQSPAELRGQLGEKDATCRNARVALMDQIEDGSLVPLGWYLSPAARASLDRQASEIKLLPCDLGW